VWKEYLKIIIVAKARGEVRRQGGLTTTGTGKLVSQFYWELKM